MEKLVVSKHQAKVDEKKKQVLDKHLNFLVDQTERYSRMLAKDITRANLINDISTSENRKEKEIIINVENQTNTMEIDETSKKDNIETQEKSNIDIDKIEDDEEEDEDKNLYQL